MRELYIFRRITMQKKVKVIRLQYFDWGSISKFLQIKDNPFIPTRYLQEMLR